MENSKFHQLCGAYDLAQNNFDVYQKECHAFSMELVKELKAYYQIPESQFSLYKVNEKEGFELVSPALIHAISLASDHYWNFGVGITVCRAPETLPEELILIHIAYRKNQKGDYVVKHGQTDKEFKVTKGNSASYLPFFDYLFKLTYQSYQNHLQQFLGEKTVRKLGYVQ